MDRIRARRRISTYVASGLSALILCSCFGSVGRLSFAGEGEKQGSVDLKAGDVRFAADVEVKYTGEAAAHYDVDLLQGGRVVGMATCDPLDLGGRKSCMYRFGNHDFDCSVVMKCRAHLDAGGPTVVRARLVISEKPKNFELKHADLVIGQ